MSAPEKPDPSPRAESSEILCDMKGCGHLFNSHDIHGGYRVCIECDVDNEIHAFCHEFPDMNGDVRNLSEGWGR
jgi:hypothetical protein